MLSISRVGLFLDHLPEQAQGRQKTRRIIITYDKNGGCTTTCYSKVILHSKVVFYETGRRKFYNRYSGRVVHAYIATKSWGYSRRGVRYALSALLA